MALTISDETLQAAGLTPQETLIELACHLFDTGRLALWPAAQLAGHTRLEFERELHARKIAIYRPTVADLEHDLAALERLRR